MDHIRKHLPQVPQENQAPLLLALKRYASGEEERLGKALSGIKIAQLTEVEPLKEALRYAMALIGLRAQNLPADEEKLVLIQYIAHHYGGHTVEELRLAFELALSGVLNVEVTCYENFSVAYFCSIMNAYREWARQAEPHTRPKPNQCLPETQTDDEEFIRSVYEFYRRHHNWRLIPPYAYKVLRATLNLNKEAKYRIKKKVDDAIGNEATKDSYKAWAVKEYFDWFASGVEEPFQVT